MKVVDLFCGLKGWSIPFEEHGHEIFTTDFQQRFEPDVCADILELTVDDMPAGWKGASDLIVLASPPCEAFSVLRLTRNWTGPGDYPRHAPKTDKARRALEIVAHTRALIEALDPAFFIIENPLGKLRKLPVLAEIERRTVTYCQYGTPWRKPTDLWGGFPPSLILRPCCKAGEPCHLASPRGWRRVSQSDTSIKHPRIIEWAEREHRSRWDEWKRQAREATGASSNKTFAALRAVIPRQLAEAVRDAAEIDVAAGRRWELEAQGSLFGQPGRHQAT